MPGARRRSAPAAAIAGAVLLVVAGVPSGLLIEEHGGVLGALEWVLRTLVVVGAVLFVAGGLGTVLRLRRRVRSRPLGWVLAVVAFLAAAWFVALPVGFGVYLTHLPLRKDVRDADLGAPKEAVTVPGADGLELRGWYVPSRNRAAVIAMHGTGNTRLGVSRHATLLARHGYGVLALDLPGHGESDGRSTSAAWLMDDDVAAAARWLAARRDVDPEKVALLGVSLGGEVALRVAAGDDGVRATVAEGAMGGAKDARDAGQGPLALAQLAVLGAVGTVLSGEGADADADLVERIAPRPLMLISAGTAAEADANRVFARRGGASTEHWNLPGAKHATAIRADAAGYEERVVGFLDRALAPRD